MTTQEASADKPAQEDRYVINLPFQGFYESWYSGEVDSQEESFIEHEVNCRQKEDDVPEHLRVDRQELQDILMDVTDYSAAYRAAAKAYVDAFDRVISEELDLPLRLEFEEMTSPRYYNFETDRVFAFIPASVVAALFERSAADSHEALKRVIKERFTSRDGFISHYRNTLDAWLEKPLDQWDHNELCTLLLSQMEPLSQERGETWDWKVYYAVVDCDGLYQEWESAVDWERYEAKVTELRDEKRAAWLAEHPEEAMPEPRCDQTGELPL